MQQREILFRAKRIHTGEWIFGPSILFFPDGEVYIYPEDGLDSPDSYQVDPKTVCQYTGLQDKNGVKIFEGDVVVIPGKYPFFDDGQPNYVGVIEFIFGCWQYVMKCVNPGKRGISDGINHILDEDGDGGKKYEIIGNIHDNPELIN